MMTVAAMLSREGRRQGIRDNDDGEEEVVKVDDSNKTVAASGGGSRQKGGCVCVFGLRLRMSYC